MSMEDRIRQQLEAEMKDPLMKEVSDIVTDWVWTLFKTFKETEDKREVKNYMDAATLHVIDRVNEANYIVEVVRRAEKYFEGKLPKAVIEWMIPLAVAKIILEAEKGRK